MVHIRYRIREAHSECSRSSSTSGHKHPGWKSEDNFSPKECYIAGTRSLQVKKNVKCFKNGYRTLRDTMVERPYLEAG